MQCFGAEGDRSTYKKEITIAVNSETGGMDPAGNIALTYLSYSVTALDELLTFDEMEKSNAGRHSPMR